MTNPREIDNRAAAFDGTINSTNLATALQVGRLPQALKPEAADHIITNLGFPPADHLLSSGTAAVPLGKHDYGQPCPIGDVGVFPNNEGGMDVRRREGYDNWVKLN